MFKRVLVLTVAAFCGAGCDGSEDGDESAGGSAQAAGGGGSGDVGAGGEGAPGGAGDPGGGGPGGPGIHITGSFNGAALTVDCAPPSDYTVGRVFQLQSPLPELQLWSFNCHAGDHTTTRVMLKVNRPMAGETLTQPDAGDRLDIVLGDPLDVTPLGALSANRTSMTLTVTAADFATKRLAGSFSASWSDDGGGKFGEVTGTIDVTGWE